MKGYLPCVEDANTSTMGNCIEGHFRKCAECCTQRKNHKIIYTPAQNQTKTNMHRKVPLRTKICCVCWQFKIRNRCLLWHLSAGNVSMCMCLCVCRFRCFCPIDGAIVYGVGANKRNYLKKDKRKSVYDCNKLDDHKTSLALKFAGMIRIVHFWNVVVELFRVKNRF